jgi:hypothetical protein
MDDSKPRTQAVPFFARFLERDAPVGRAARTKDEIGIRALAPVRRRAKTKDDIGMGHGVRVLDGKRHGTL